MEYWMFSLIMLQLVIIDIYLYLYWYRKERKVKQIVGNVGYCKLQSILYNHEESQVSRVDNHEESIQTPMV